VPADLHAHPSLWRAFQAKGQHFTGAQLFDLRDVEGGDVLTGLLRSRLGQGQRGQGHRGGGRHGQDGHDSLKAHSAPVVGSWRNADRIIGSARRARNDGQHHTVSARGKNLLAEVRASLGRPDRRESMSELVLSASTSAAASPMAQAPKHPSTDIDPISCEVIRPRGGS
jgi:hypothetical protein